MSQQSAKLIPESERCEVCHGEAEVSYHNAKGYSEPSPCYKCDGTGRKAPPSRPVSGDPVAWRHRDDADGYWVLSYGKPKAKWDHIEPLYTTPPAAAAGRGDQIRALQLAAEYDAGTAKCLASGYEEFGPKFQRDRKIISDALRQYGLALTPQEPATAWQPFNTAPKDGTYILAWHRAWCCPISVRYLQNDDTQCHWVEVTLTTRWPEIAFTNWMMGPPAPPLPRAEREVGS